MKGRAASEAGSMLRCTADSRRAVAGGAAHRHHHEETMCWGHSCDEEVSLPCTEGRAADLGQATGCITWWRCSESRL